MMFIKKRKELKLSEIKKKCDISTYINKMKTNNFIGTYDYEHDTYLYFINETLTDYLIARFLFERTNGLDIVEIEKYIDEI